MKVREVLQIAREAALKIRELEERAEIRRQAIGVQGHNSFEVHAKTGILDPMRHVVELLDWQNELIDADDLNAPIEEAYEIVRGAEKIIGDTSTEIITRYYLQGESWRELVDGYERDGISCSPLEKRDRSLAGLSKAKQLKRVEEDAEASIEKMEQIGIAHLKEMGRR